MRSLVVASLLVAGMPGPGLAQVRPHTALAEASGSDLAKPYVTTLGDMIALSMTLNYAAVKPPEGYIDGPVVALYDRQSRTVRVCVFGERGKVDGAKDALEYFRAKVFPRLADIITQIYQVQLRDQDITLVYLDRGQKLREIVRREAGRYLVAG